MVKTGHWKQFREGLGTLWEAPPIEPESEDLRKGFFEYLLRVMGDALSRKTGRGADFGRRGSLFGIFMPEGENYE